MGRAKTAAWRVDEATAGCCGMEMPMSCILAMDPDTRTVAQMNNSMIDTIVTRLNPMNMRLM